MTPQSNAHTDRGISQSKSVQQCKESVGKDGQKWVTECVQRTRLYEPMHPFPHDIVLFIEPAGEEGDFDDDEFTVRSFTQGGDDGIVNDLHVCVLFRCCQRDWETSINDLSIEKITHIGDSTRHRSPSIRCPNVYGIRYEY